MDCRSVSASFDRRCLSTPPCSISCRLSKIPYGRFARIRLQTTTPAGVCLGQPRLKGTRLSTPTAPSWLRPTGLPTRSRSSRYSACHDGGDHESSTGPFLAGGCVVLRVFGTTPRSGRLGAPPISRSPLIRAALPFAGAPGRPQVLPCFAKLSVKPRRRPYAGRATRCTFPSLPGCCQSSPFGTGLDSFFVPDGPISRGTFSTRQSSLHATVWCLASPRVRPRLAATGTLSSRLSPGESPPPDARFATWPNGNLPRPDLQRLDILGYRLHYRICTVKKSGC